MLQESGEMYLETIYVLTRGNGCVRSVDISEHMGYSKPSVSRAVHILIEKGYIEMDGEGFITLTPDGEARAARIFERHTVLTRVLMRLGVSPETASMDACKMEHTLSEETYQTIKKYFEQN